MMAGLTLWRSLGDPHAIALGLNFIVPTLLKLGKYEEAEAFMQESIDLCERSKNRWGMGTAYSFLGQVYIAEGQYAAAKSQLLKSLGIFSEYITGWNIAHALTLLGHATRMAGETAEARKYYLEAVRQSVETEALPITLDALSGLCVLLEQAGEAMNALAQCYYILKHPSSDRDTIMRAEQLRARLERGLSSDEITMAHTTAAGQSLDEIVKVALKA
jgi:tetratricopeptide (TPR) repeat protein